MSLRSMTRVDGVASLGMFAYASSIVVTPIILIRLAEELDFGLAAGGGIEAVRAGFLLAVLVASGVAASRLGKAHSLAFGGIMLAAGLFFYAVAPAYGFVLAAVVLVGLGGGVFEGLLNPLVQDAHPTDSGRYLNITNAFFSVGILVSVLVVGDLLTRGVGWRYLVAGVGALALVTGILFVPLARAERVMRQTQGFRISVGGESRAILGDKRFWAFAVAMFCGGGAEGGFTFWSASYAQLTLGAMARGGAFATAAFSAGMVVGRLASGHFVSQDRLPVLIIGSAVLGVGASMIAWAVSGLVSFMVVLFVAGLSIACFWPSIQSHAASRMKFNSTILFILLSVGGIPGYGLTSWIMGIVAETRGLRASLLVLPALLVILTVAMIAAQLMPDRRHSPAARPDTSAAETP